MTVRSVGRITASVGLLLGIVWVAGCGSKDPPPPGEPVTGKLTIKGKAPGTYASIVFVSATDPSQKMTGSVDPTGMFSGRAPQGKVKVALKEGKVGGGPPTGPSRFPTGGRPGGPPGGPPGGQVSDAPPKMKGAVELSANAQDPNKSGVEIDVPKEGVQNLELNFDK